MPLASAYGGYDISGSSGSLFRVACIVTAQDMEQVGIVLDEVRRFTNKYRLPEFHGHNDNTHYQVALLTAVQKLDLRVGIAICRQPIDLRDKIAPISVINSYIDLSLRLLGEFFSTCKLEKLWCDDDFRGKQQQKQIRTAIKRLHRSVWPGSQLGVGFPSSEDSDIVQIADVVAYGMYRLAVGKIRDAEWRSLLEQIKRNPRNLVQEYEVE